MLTPLSGATGTLTGSDGARVPDQRLVRAAREFEAQMMKELLAPMHQQSALFEDADSEETGILGDFASESLAGALSVRGGLGMADRIVQELSRSGPLPTTTSATEITRGNPEMSPRKSLK